MVESPSKTDPSSPHMQVRTCNLCRGRRVKCDRQVPSCSSCLRSEVNCVYPPGRGRAPKRPRHGVAPQLSERLSRLESIIHQFGSASQENHPARESFHTEQLSLDQDFSRLKIAKSKSYYVNNALWVTLSNEVEELHDLLFEPADEDADFELAPSTYTLHPSPTDTTDTSPPIQLGLNAAIFGYRALASSLQPFYPPLHHGVALFAAFTGNVAPLVRIFHMPTLTTIYWDAITSLDSIDKYNEALLFAIYYSAVVSLTPEQCLSILEESREAALQKYRFAVEQALARGNLLNTQNITMLQAAVLFLSALPNEDDSRAVWSLTSLIHHIARTMGLHRDGTAFGLNPFETELRRRLWWQICIIDSRSSEYRCNEPIAQGDASDVKLPLHVDDADLWPDMQEPPAERWDHATDMTLSLVRCEAIQTGWKLRLAKPDQTKGSTSRNQGNASPTAVKSQILVEQRQCMVQNLELRFRDKYLSICDSSVPIQFLSSAVARIIIARFKLITRHSGTSRQRAVVERSWSRSFPEVSDSTNQLENDTRDEIFQTSIEMLDVSGMLLTNRDIMQWSWYSRTHIQWSAMAFVLSELCTRPRSPECDRAWDCVTTVYDAWKANGNQTDVGRLALGRTIRRLMAKARLVRQTRQMECEQIGNEAQQHDPPLSPPAGGAFSYHPSMTHKDSWYTSTTRLPTSMPMRESSLLDLSSTSFSKEPSRILPGVSATAILDPFKDFLPDWSLADSDGDVVPWLADSDLELLPSLP